MMIILKNMKIVIALRIKDTDVGMPYSYDGSLPPLHNLVPNPKPY